METAIKVENLSKSFGSLEVLKGISFSAFQGDVLTLLGSSGSGKSTLLRCLNLLEVPEEGEIFFQGEPVRFKIAKGNRRLPGNARQLVKIRSRFSMVFQQFNLWSHMTALQNVAEAPRRVLKLGRKEALERARFYLEKVGLERFGDYHPVRLSGGQQQRAAIARALAMEPAVLLFDEPTSALDPERVSEVLKVIRRLAEEGRTMLIVTHEIGFAREVSNRSMFLHEGRIEEDGAPDKFFFQPDSERLKRFLTAMG